MEKYKYCKNADNWDRYKASRNKVTSEFRLARYEYDTKVNRLKVPDGTLTTNDRETANVLNEFFASVFEKEGDGDLNKVPSSVVEAPSVNSFKSRLNRHWTNHPSKFNPPCYIPHATGQIARYSQQCSNAPQEAEMA